MNFKSDLNDIIESYFLEERISYQGSDEASDLAARFCEMLIRRIAPKPRAVNFSNELNESLGKLISQPSKGQKLKALEAWRAVFCIRNLFVTGGNVRPYLSKRINDSTQKDKILWDYGMHHFHLGRTLDHSGFIERSDYLLFAIVADEDVFFVDIREHYDPDDLLWVRQDLLRIVHSNWPEITEPRLLHGVSGDTVTDIEKRELRRKNLNLVADVEGHSIAPLRMGVTSDGSSVFCRVWADRLMHEVERHEAYFYSQPLEVRARLEAMGVDLSGEMDLKLVQLDSLNPSDEMIWALQEDGCLSRDLCRMGFAIVEARTRLPIAVLIEEDQ